MLGGAFSIVFGTLVAGLAWWMLRQVAAGEQRAAGWPRVEGTLTSITRRKDHDGRLRDRAEYTYPLADGTVVHGEDVYPGGAATAGDPVVVAVDPQDPARSVLPTSEADARTMRTILLVFIAAGMLFALIGAIQLVTGVAGALTG